ncbi:Juvenile hormone epoxide hydrolase [Eumeta japonica]|uniref:Juvenile hormone epoxide hydrolase n=1 Tax=Eumeta variegata TaxID=151549 RepID=A0A4C1V1Y2_EUMVA|nr:Juvenile hormone epoxide hydrolase [Eumeta japonica]
MDDVGTIGCNELHAASQRDGWTRCHFSQSVPRGGGIAFARCFACVLLGDDTGSSLPFLSEISIPTQGAGNKLMTPLGLQVCMGGDDDLHFGPAMVNKLLAVAVLGGIGFVVWRYLCPSCHPPKPPVLDADEWWGPDHLKATRDESIKPFKVVFKPDMIKDLKDRLSRARKWTPSLEGVAFEYGFNSKSLEKVLQYWKDSYQFEAREKYLNTYPQFTTFIQGLNIHFIRVKPDATQGVEEEEEGRRGLIGAVDKASLIKEAKVQKKQERLKRIRERERSGQIKNLHSERTASTRDWSSLLNNDFLKYMQQVVPLLLLHGWPGSVREFYELIPLLTKQRPGRNFVFEVVVPSLPGYGFSDAAVRPGLATPQIAVIMRNLMRRLGHKKFYVQGGDWGSVIVSNMATLFPEDILGHHTNMPFVQHKCTLLKTLIGSVFPSWVVEEKYAERMYPLSKFFSFLLEESGYLHLQATKPDTVGVALTDSPAGLAAYILEKFSTWTVFDYKHLPDGGLTKKFTLDQLLDNLMIYWSTSSITTAMRLYSEDFSIKKRALKLENIPSPVPTWVLQARYELAFQPAGLLKYKYPNLINVTILDEGGHFLAFEMPAVVADDVFNAVSAFKDWHKNKAKEGKTEL